MASQTLPQSLNPVRRPLQADGLVCAVSGLIFTLDAEPIRRFIGLEASLPIFILGLIILVYGIALFLYTTYKTADRRMAVAAIVLNVLWIVGSALLLLADPFHFTTEGKWLVLILADIVAVLAIWEFLSIRRLRPNS